MFSQIRHGWGSWIRAGRRVWTVHVFGTTIHGSYHDLKHQLTREITDGIRYPSHSSRSSPDLSTGQRTTTARSKRHGIQILFLREEFCNDRCHVQWNRMLHRRSTSEKRLNKQCCRRMHHRRSSGIQSWTSSCSPGVWRFRGFLGSH
jgi:hypothetical protein